MTSGARSNMKRASSISSALNSNGESASNMIEKPMTPFISATNLIKILSKNLPPKNTCFVKKIQKACIEKRINRRQMAVYIRKVVGDDELLAKAIKSSYDKAATESIISKLETLNIKME